MKISEKMKIELQYVAQHGWQGEMVFTHRNTEDALRRRGFITNEYDDTHFAAKKWGYRNPVLTVAGWAASGVARPADPGRYTFDEALNEARLKYGDWWKNQEPVRDWFFQNDGWVLKEVR